ncbi:MAG: hypothetical protein ABIQ35_13570 [Verrucomicrobiota bacterium]
MNKATESPCNEATFVGNRLGTCLDLLGPDKKSLRQKFLIGEPRRCAAGTGEEMKRRGYVGIYQKEREVRFRLPYSNLVIQKTW